MEPFGILRMLQSLLPKDESTATAAPAAPQTNDEKTVEPDAQPSLFATKENACWEFMQAHDRRAKPLRKR